MEMQTTPPSAWRWLGAAPETIARGEDDAYYGRVRGDVLDLIVTPPATVLDVGCGGGATGGELKRRFPGTVVTGIESVADAARIAATRIDRAIHADAEHADFEAYGIARGTLDLAIVADVLEHMYDPWHFLERVRPLLAPHGKVLASIPNIRNLWLLDKIVRGYFDYRDEGLLDITHIRFFTYAEMRALFAATGYAVERTRFNVDGNLPERVPLKRLPGPSSLRRFAHAARSAFDPAHRGVLVSRERGGTFRVETARLALAHLTTADLDELFASQIYLVAAPASATDGA